MGETTVRDLRNHGGRVLDRVLAGEHVTITRNGRPVARLEPLAQGLVGVDALIARFRELPDVDPQRLRQVVDALLDKEV